MIDQSKKYTYGEFSCRILATDLKGEFPIAIAYATETYESVVCVNEHHLVEVKPETVPERWTVVPNLQYGFATKEEAADAARPYGYGVAKITFDGLAPKPVVEPEWEFPSWIKAPWLALDELGNALLFLSEPYLSCDRWTCLGGFWLFNQSVFDFQLPPGTDWRTSKRKNPRVT